MRNTIKTNENYDTKGGRTESEQMVEHTLCGFNVIKVARMINIVAGIVIVVVSALSAVNVFSLFFDNIGRFFLNIFLW